MVVRRGHSRGCRWGGGLLPAASASSTTVPVPVPVSGRAVMYMSPASVPFVSHLLILPHTALTVLPSVYKSSISIATYTAAAPTSRCWENMVKDDAHMHPRTEPHVNCSGGGHQPGIQNQFGCKCKQNLDAEGGQSSLEALVGLLAVGGVVACLSHAWWTTSQMQTVAACRGGLRRNACQNEPLPEPQSLPAATANHGAAFE
jgi:hypothetical protein